MRVLLERAGAEHTLMVRRRAETLYEQGESADGVLYLDTGGVKLSVRSAEGREAIVAILGAGEFVGEGALAGQSIRAETATALTNTRSLVVSAAEMTRVLHADRDLAVRFVGHLLNRTLRIEEDLVDQIFNSTEKRLARTLLRLAHYGAPGTPDRVLPATSRATLADMAGTTVAKVDVLLAKFRRLGFIENGPAGLTVDRSLLTVVLRD